MSFSFSDILFLFLLFLLLFLSVFLLTADKGKRISNVLPGLFFLAIFLNLADSFLLLKQFYMQFPRWALWGSTMILACGPLLLLYVQSILYKDFHYKHAWLLHFIPFIVLFVFTEISYLSAGEMKQMQVLQDILNRKLPAAFYIPAAFIYIHFIAYLVKAFGLVRQYSRAAVNKFSNDQNVTLSWLRTVILFFLLLMLAGAVSNYLSLQQKTEAYFVALSITVLLLLLFIVFVFMKALKNPGIFSGWNEEELQEASQPVKYAASGLTQNEKQKILDGLLEHIQIKKPYLEPELTLDQLASQLSLKPKILSQVINEMRGQNFFEFINKYRIEEAQRLLTKPKDKKITVLEVMYSVGFNSKSSFNTLFKKYTGITPSEFKKQNL